MEKLKTVRRDKLRRLAEAGRLVMVSSYSYDDMTGADRSKGEMPVRMVPPGHPDWWKERIEGCAYLHYGDFDSCSGRAYDRGDGLVVLHVHSNCNFTFRVLPETKKGKAA